MNFSSRIVIGLVAIKAEEVLFFLMFFEPVWSVSNKIVICLHVNL